MYYYAFSLRTASFLMANGTWTKNHVDSILAHSDPLLDYVHYLPPLVLLKFLESRSPPKEATRVYPPCDTRAMVGFSLEGRERVILSVAQFRYVLSPRRYNDFLFQKKTKLNYRPEKDHAAQLLSLDRLRKTHPEYFVAGKDQIKLVLLGGSRNDGDAARVERLRALAKELEIEVRPRYVS